MSAYQSQQNRESRWCTKCQCSMELVTYQPCVLPRFVVYGKNRVEPSDYGKYLIKLGRNEAAPPGSFVCNAHLYRCPECGRRKARLTLLTPDKQKVYVYERGEIDNLFR